MIISGDYAVVEWTILNGEDLQVTGANCVIRNCTVHDGVINIDASCLIFNTIGDNSGGDDINIATGCTVTGRHNCFADAGAAGAGTYEDSVSTTLWSSDPLFNDANGGDFSLDDLSPCIDAGQNSTWIGQPDVEDYNGIAITDGVGNIIAPGGIVDIGAIELFVPAKYTQYKFPAEHIFCGVNVWVSGTAHVYVGHSQDGVTWSFFKAEADHTLDNANKLIVADSEADAQTNFWTIGPGKNSALFAEHRQAKYLRLYYTHDTIVTIHELKFNSQVIADEVICFTLSSIVANLGDVNIGNVTGGNGSVKCYNSSAQKTIEMTTAGNLSTYRASTGAEICRLGNLNGFLGYTSATDGIAIGENTKFLKFDLTNGLRIATADMTILSGGDLTLIGSDSDPGKLKFVGTSHTVEIGGDASGDRFDIIPINDNAISCQIGNIAGWWPSTAARRFTNIVMAARNAVSLHAYDGTTAVPPYTSLALYSGTSSEYMRLDVATSAANAGFYRWYYNAFSPGGHKTMNMGDSTNYAWNTIYADDFTNVADFYNLDSHDDLAAIHQIKGSGVTLPYNNLEIIDDDTLPNWLLARHQKDSDDDSHKRGDPIYDRDGRPYLSLKTMISLCMGAIRQLDNKVIQLEG